MANRATVTVHVLIVDDQAAFRRAAARVLGRLPGFEVVGEADTGEASIDLARSLRPDLVLMDIHLPGIDGTTATRRILTEAALSRKLPLVFLLSTYDAVDYASQTVACGASAYLAKAEFGPTALQPHLRQTGRGKSRASGCAGENTRPAGAVALKRAQDEEETREEPCRHQRHPRPRAVAHAQRFANEECQNSYGQHHNGPVAAQREVAPRRSKVTHGDGQHMQSNASNRSCRAEYEGTRHASAQHWVAGNGRPGCAGAAL